MLTITFDKIFGNFYFNIIITTQLKGFLKSLKSLSFKIIFFIRERIIKDTELKVEYEIMKLRWNQLVEFCKSLSEDKLCKRH